jgi:hypothetical protein
MTTPLHSVDRTSGSRIGLIAQIATAILVTVSQILVLSNLTAEGMPWVTVAGVVSGALFVAALVRMLPSASGAGTATRALSGLSAAAALGCVWTFVFCG